MESYSRKTRPLKKRIYFSLHCGLDPDACCSTAPYTSALDTPPGVSPCTAVLTRHVRSPRTPVLGSPTRRRRAWRAAGRCSSPMSSAWLGSQRADDASWGKLSCAGAGDRVVAAHADATARPLQGEVPSPGTPQGYSPAGAGPLPRPRHPKGKVWGF